jgi:hypothetical protein
MLGSPKFNTSGPWCRKSPVATVSSKTVSQTFQGTLCSRFGDGEALLEILAGDSITFGNSHLTTLDLA